MLQDCGQKNHVIGPVQALCTLDRSTFDLDLIFLTRNLRKRVRHFYAANAPPSIGRTPQELPTATAELEHATWSPEYGFCKGGQVLTQDNLPLRSMVLKIILWCVFGVRVEFR